MLFLLLCGRQLTSILCELGSIPDQRHTLVELVLSGMSCQRNTSDLSSNPWQIFKIFKI